MGCGGNFLLNEKGIYELEYNELQKISEIMWIKSEEEYKNTNFSILNWLNENKDNIKEKLDKKERKILDKLIKKEIYKYIMKYRQLHSKLVADLACKIYKENFFEADECENKLLYLASLLHDIKKMDKKHHREGKCFIKNNLCYAIKESGFEVSVDNKTMKKLGTIIEMHKVDKEPEWYYDKIEKMKKRKLTHQVFCIRIADKLSKLEYQSFYTRVTNDDFIRLKEKINNITNDLIEIDESLGNKKNEILNNFYNEKGIK